MPYRVITSIPPQPSVIEATKKWTSVSPLHISHCKNRIVYGVDTGVAVRSLPNRVPAERENQVKIYGVAKRPITCASASRDGRIVVGGNSDGHVHVWTNESPDKIIHNVYKLDRMRHLHMSDICVSSDSTQIVAVGFEKHAKVHGAVLDSDDGTVLGIFTAHGAASLSRLMGYRGIASVTMTSSKPYNIVTAGLDGRLCLFSGPPYKLRMSIDSGCTALTCARYSPDGSMLICLGIDGYMAVFDRSLSLISDADLGSVTPISCDWLSKKNTRIFAIACDDYSIHGLRVDNEKHTINVLFNLNLNRNQPRGVLWTDNMWLVIPTEGGVILSWACLAADKELDLEFGAHCLEPPSGDSTISDDLGRYECCKVNEQADLVSLGLRGGASAVSYDVTTQQWIVGTNLGYLMFLDGSRVVPRAFQVRCVDPDRRLLACLTNGDYAVSLSANGGLKFLKYIRKTLIPEAVIAEQVGKFRELANSRLALLNRPVESEVHIEVIFEHVVESCQAPCLGFIGGREHVALFGESGEVRVYRITTGEEIWKAEINSSPLLVDSSDDGSIICVAVEVSSKYPFVGALQGICHGEIVIEVYEILDGSNADGMHFVQIIRTGETKVSAIALNYNGSFLAFAVGNRIKVQQVGNHGGNLLIDGEWNMHKTKVYNLAWSLSGTKLVSTSANEILVWNLSTKKLATRLLATHSGHNTFAKFQMENVVITGGAEGLLTIHQLDETDANELDGPIQPD